GQSTASSALHRLAGEVKTRGRSRLRGKTRSNSSSIRTIRWTMARESIPRFAMVTSKSSSSSLPWLGRASWISAANLARPSLTGPSGRASLGTVTDPFSSTPIRLLLLLERTGFPGRYRDIRAEHANPFQPTTTFPARIGHIRPCPGGLGSDTCDLGTLGSMVDTGQVGSSIVDGALIQPRETADPFARLAPLAG